MKSSGGDIAAVWGSAAPSSRPPRLLGLFAHPDDEVFCVGGTIARCAEAGAVTSIVSLTRGEAGQIRDGSTTRRALRTVRLEELEQAAAALGVNQVTCMDLGDGLLDRRPPGQLAAAARTCIDQFEPDVVVTFGPDGAFGHRDHVASCVATMEAIGAMAHPPRLLHSRFPVREQLLLDVLVEWLTSEGRRFKGTTAFGHALKLLADGSSMLGLAADHFDVEWFPAGSFLIEQGEPGTTLYFILSGTVDVVVESADGGRRWKNTLGAGCFVGEDALATGAARNAHVIARGGVTCLVLSPHRPSSSAGRPAGAPITSPTAEPVPPTAGSAGEYVSVDVRAVLGPKVAALAAHRSQYAMQPDMFPPAVFERLLGTEHFSVVSNQRASITVIGGRRAPTTDNVTPRRYEPDSLRAAEADFVARFPDFDPDGSLPELRRSEYGRLDADDHVYLDYTGGGLHAASQIEDHANLLRTRVLGNPHSNNPTSMAATDLVQRARQVVCEFFNAPPEDYLCVFTSNASAALRLVGESYPFAPSGAFALTVDNHNSVNGIREFARRKGAHVAYVPVVAPELRIDREAMAEVLAAGDPTSRNLLAFPAQSNFSGVQHRLELVEEAHEAGWDVLVDAAAFAPTNGFDVAHTRPDFATFSFYKMIGFPTGVGCLLLRRDRFDVLNRPWFAGGTVTVASVQGDGHYLHRDETAFEDGTVDYLNLPAVETGLRHLRRIGLDRIHTRVECLTRWLLDALADLRHSNGRRVVQIYGPTDSHQRGGTVTFQLHDCDGRPIDDLQVEERASSVNISLRTGCFCNPGAGEIAHHLSEVEMAKWFARDEPMSFPELRRELPAEHDTLVGAIRISVGLATNFPDVYRFLSFMQNFVDRRVDEMGRIELEPDRGRSVLESA